MRILSALFLVWLEQQLLFLGQQTMQVNSLLAQFIHEDAHVVLSDILLVELLVCIVFEY